jgi:two-component system, NtrC family, nitrogen regulation response regulator NtrX
MSDSTDTILVVDDVVSVRDTFREWLESASLGCRIVSAADAESALALANQHLIDLAILDWNLETGDNGLELLQDLYAFNPDVVAILVTGYAAEATPLEAMRMGVRDYLDKNHDLNRGTFLQSVRRQLERIRPAKRVRELHTSLVAFRESIQKILPLVESAAALNEPVPLPDAIGALVRFLIRTTEASDGVLLVRRFDAAANPVEVCRVYDGRGEVLPAQLVPFARSIAGTAITMQEPCVMNELGSSGASVELQPFEVGRRNLLAVPLIVGPGVQAVIELFDQRTGRFRPEDLQLVRAAAEIGTELLRQALGHRQAQQLLLDAVEAALGASDQMDHSLQGGAGERLEQPPPEQVLDQLRAGLSGPAGDDRGAEISLRLAEAIRVLGLRHGERALEHCITLVEGLRGLLDGVTGM